MMTFKYKKHVSIVCHLFIGQAVTVSGWGHELDGKKCIIEDIIFEITSESSVMVKLDKYPSYIDSNWIN